MSQNRTIASCNCYKLGIIITYYILDQHHLFCGGIRKRQVHPGAWSASPAGSEVPLATSAAMQSISKQLIDRFVTETMSAEAVNAATMETSVELGSQCTAHFSARTDPIDSLWPDLACKKRPDCTDAPASHSSRPARLVRGEQPFVCCVAAYRTA